MPLVRERTMPRDRPPLVGEVVPIFADRGCCVVSATDYHGRLYLYTAEISRPNHTITETVPDISRWEQLQV
jgi:hypothetical protein